MNKELTFWTAPLYNRNHMAKKNDLKNSMSAGLTGGLDSLIIHGRAKEAQKPKKAKTVQL